MIPVQTSAPDTANCRMEFTGVLASRAHVAMKPIDSDGHFVPVLELHLQDVGNGHHSVVAHIPYLPHQRAAADAQAKCLQRGQRVTVSTELADIRMLLPAASLSTDDS